MVRSNCLQVNSILRKEKRTQKMYGFCCSWVVRKIIRLQDVSTLHVPYIVQCPYTCTERPTRVPSPTPAWVDASRLRGGICPCFDAVRVNSDTPIPFQTPGAESVVIKCLYPTHAKTEALRGRWNSAFLERGALLLRVRIEVIP